MGQRVYECVTCGTALTDENRAPRRSICLPCRTEESRRQRREYTQRRGPLKLSDDRRRWLLSRYGLTEEAYAALVEQQGGGCAICGRDLEPGREKHSLVIDHDHACCPLNWRGVKRTHKTCGGCVRGVLCGACNRGLGQFADRPELLEKGAAYLRQYADRKVS